MTLASIYLVASPIAQLQHAGTTSLIHPMLHVHIKLLYTSSLPAYLSVLICHEPSCISLSILFTSKQTQPLHCIKEAFMRGMHEVHEEHFSLSCKSPWLWPNVCGLEI